MKKLLIFAISAMLIMVGCGKNETDDNKPNKPDSENPEKPDDSDSDKLPELPDPTDVCSGMDDFEFMRYCYIYFDDNQDGKISEQEAKAAKKIECDNLKITSFKGIEYFPNLETFSCKSNSKVKAIDLSHNKKISYLPIESLRNCTSLTSIALPNSITLIGDKVFDGCTSLSGVYITDIVAWCSIDFGDNPLSYAHNLYLNGKLVTDLVIPNSATQISDYAFSGCTSITSVSIPDSVTKIGLLAFGQCAGLTSITFGKGVTEIGWRTFRDCTNLPSVTIPDSVTKIGEQSFFGCTGLTSVTIGKGVTEIGVSAFHNCTGLTNVTIPDKVTKIGDLAFYECTNLKSVYCKPTTPPALSHSTASDYDQTFPSCTIYVPQASINRYKSAYGWAHYASRIQGYNF